MQDPFDYSAAFPAPQDDPQLSAGKPTELGEPALAREAGEEQWMRRPSSEGGGPGEEGGGGAVAEVGA